MRKIIKKMIWSVLLMMRWRCLWNAIKAEKMGDQRLALKKWKIVAKEIPEYRKGGVRCVMLLSQLGKSDEAEQLLKQLSASHPGHKDIQKARVKLLRNERRYLLAAEKCRDLIRQFPDDIKIKVIYIRCLLDIADFDQAQELYDRFFAKESCVNYKILQPTIYSSQRQLDKALILLNELQLGHPKELSVVIKKSKILLQMCRRYGDLEFARRALTELDKYKGQHFSNYKLLETVIAILVVLNDRDRALSYIKTMPGEHQSGMELKIWALSVEGDIETAKLLWEEMSKRCFVPQIQALSFGVLRKTDPHDSELADNAIIVFTVVRNERWRLPFFLDYYRSLGVDHFFFVDNDSSDGTADYLHKHSDVSVFWTDQSYAEASSGMQWVNALIDEYGADKWCLYVDVDEALVFPHSEKCGLRLLTQYMSEKGHEALYGFMMDMFAPGLESVKRKDDYMGFLTDYPLFQNQYFKTSSAHCPYVHITGGIRWIFGLDEIQTKTPIIRGGKGIKFLSSSHKISPAILSDVTCVLLHFKFAGDFRSSFEQDLVENNRRAGCIRRHQSYLNALKDLSLEDSVKNNFTESYRSSQQLVDMGIITTTDEFNECVDTS